MQNDNDVEVGALSAIGGSGATGAGGSGAAINVHTLRSSRSRSRARRSRRHPAAGDRRRRRDDRRDRHERRRRRNQRRERRQRDRASARGRQRALARLDHGDAVGTAPTATAGAAATSRLRRRTATSRWSTIRSPRAAATGANTDRTALGGSGGKIILTTGSDEDATGDVRLRGELDAGEGASDEHDRHACATSTAARSRSLAGETSIRRAAGTADHAPAGTCRSPRTTTSAGDRKIARAGRRRAAASTGVPRRGRPHGQRRRDRRRRRVAERPLPRRPDVTATSDRRRPPRDAGTVAT